MPDISLAARSNMHGLLHDHGIAPSSVSVADLDGMGLSSLHALGGDHAGLLARFAQIYGLELPEGPRRALRHDIAAVGVGPGKWLVARAGAESRLAAELHERLGDVAAVNDQGDGHALLRLSGSAARNVLAKGCGIDLHHKAFPVNASAGTAIAHIGVTLWRCEDAPDGAPVFEIMLFRSLAQSFWHWLALSAAEFGLHATTPLTD